MENWLENWSKTDFLAFFSAVLGLAAMLLGAVNTLVQVSAVDSAQRRRRYHVSIYAILSGALIIITSTSYLLYSRARKPAAVSVEIPNNSPPKRATPQVLASPEKISTPQQSNVELVKRNNFNISSKADADRWRHDYCVHGDFSVEVIRGPDYINFNVVNAVINACTSSNHEYTRLSKIRLGIWRDSEKPKQGGSPTVWSDHTMEETILPGKDHPLKPFTSSIKGKIPQITSEQTLIIQLVFKQFGDAETKVSFFDRNLRFSN
jgi:hypothetical protein